LKRINPAKTMERHFRIIWSLGFLKFVLQIYNNIEGYSTI
jgi:hypothetical protein